jgi:hypothetical protein
MHVHPVHPPWVRPWRLAIHTCERIYYFLLLMVVDPMITCIYKVFICTGLSQPDSLNPDLGFFLNLDLNQFFLVQTCKYFLNKFVSKSALLDRRGGLPSYRTNLQAPALERAHPAQNIIFFSLPFGAMAFLDLDPDPRT